VSFPLGIKGVTIEERLPSAGLASFRFRPRLVMIFDILPSNGGLSLLEILLLTRTGSHR
jgi:hypothetical protein